MCGRYMLFFFFNQKTAYEMRISDWSSDVCSSDLVLGKVKSASADAVVVTTPGGDDVSLPRSAFLMSPTGLAAAYTADQFAAAVAQVTGEPAPQDRKSTRLNSSH